MILKCSASFVTQNQRSNSDIKMDNRKYLGVLNRGGNKNVHSTKHRGASLTTATIIQAQKY